MARSSNGFSVLELLIIAGMIAIIMALAVPNLVAARRAANEASAVAELKSFLNANHAFYGVHNTFTSPNSLYQKGFINDDFGTRLRLASGAGSGGDGQDEGDRDDRNGGDGDNRGKGSGDGDSDEGSGDGEGGDDFNEEETPKEDTPFRIVFRNTGYYFIMVPVEVSAKIDSGSGKIDYTLSEYYMIAVPESYYNGGFFQTGTRAFYIDSVSNAPLSVNEYPKKIDCFNEAGDATDYSSCTQIGN